MPAQRVRRRGRPWTPCACSRSITPFQLEPSAKAPWTRTTVLASIAMQCSALNAARSSVGEELGLLPGGEVAAPVDLVEVGEVGVDLLDPAARRAKTSPGNVVKPTGTETGGGAWPAASGRGPFVLPVDRAAEAPVPVSQYSVTLSRMWSRVRLPVGLPSTKAPAIL